MNEELDIKNYIGPNVLKCLVTRRLEFLSYLWRAKENLMGQVIVTN